MVDHFPRPDFIDDVSRGGALASRPPNRISVIIAVHTIPQNPFMPHTIVRVLRSCLQKPRSADVGSWDDVGSKGRRGVEGTAHFEDGGRMATDAAPGR